VNLLYNTVFIICLAIYLPLFIPVLCLSKKRRKTVLQRLGIVLPYFQNVQKGKPGAKKKPIWIHALSVGEVVAAEPLVKEISRRYEDRMIVFSVSTKTGFEVATSLLKPHVKCIFYFPYDLFFSVKRLIERVSPGFFILVESDIWPNFMCEMKRRNIKVAFVNARISNRSFWGYKRFSPIMKTVFNSFSVVCAQSAEDAERLIVLGVPSERMAVTGNVKFDQEFDPINKEDIENQKRLLKVLPFQTILLAGSTHAGEEVILLDALSKLKKQFPGLVLIIAPRDTERAGIVLNISRSKGFSTVFSEKPDKTGRSSGPDVIVVDVIGKLRKLYALADIAFVGGSLVKRGGHNPLEPAAYAKPILFGECMSDFKEISEMLLGSGGAIKVFDSTSIHDTVAMLVKDPKKAEKIGKHAKTTFRENDGAVNRTLEAVEQLASLQYTV